MKELWDTKEYASFCFFFFYTAVKNTLFYICEISNRKLYNKLVVLTILVIIVIITKRFVLEIQMKQVTD